MTALAGAAASPGVKTARIDLLRLIRGLDHSSSGLAYVYWCLEEIVRSADLERAVLVSETAGLGRQVFPARRLDWEAMDPRIWSEGEGLHVWPTHLTEADQRAVVTLCRLALTGELARHDAAHDALTGLPNRRSFDRSLAAALADADRYGSPFSFVMLDVDRLKQVNDTWGHPEGDRVLRTVGAELRRSSRANDVAARLGGDEFGLLLPRSAPDVAARLLDRVSGEVSTALGRKVTFSIGVVSAPAETAESTELYRLADARLYADKRRISEPPGA